MSKLRPMGGGAAPSEEETKVKEVNQKEVKAPSTQSETPTLRENPLRLANKKEVTETKAEEVQEETQQKADEPKNALLMHCPKCDQTNAKTSTHCWKCKKPLYKGAKRVKEGSSLNLAPLFKFLAFAAVLVAAFFYFNKDKGSSPEALASISGDVDISTDLDWWEDYKPHKAIEDLSVEERWNRQDQFAEAYDKHLKALSKKYVRDYKSHQEFIEGMEVLSEGGNAAEKLSQFYYCNSNYDANRDSQYKDKISKSFESYTNAMKRITVNGKQVML